MLPLSTHLFSHWSIPLMTIDNVQYILFLAHIIHTLIKLQCFYNDVSLAEGAAWCNVSSIPTDLSPRCVPWTMCSFNEASPHYLPVLGMA